MKTAQLALLVTAALSVPFAHAKPNQPNILFIYLKRQCRRIGKLS